MIKPLSVEEVAIPMFYVSQFPFRSGTFGYNIPYLLWTCFYRARPWSQSDCKEWAAQTLEIVIVVLTGEVTAGARATQVFGNRLLGLKEVWVLLGPSVDGAGVPAPHFDLLCKASGRTACVFWYCAILSPKKEKRTQQTLGNDLEIWSTVLYWTAAMFPNTLRVGRVFNCGGVCSTVRSLYHRCFMIWALCSMFHVNITL